MGAVARPPHGDDLGAGRRRARLGPPGVGPRRRHAGGATRAAACARRAGRTVRRASRRSTRATRSRRPRECASRTVPGSRRSSPRSRPTPRSTHRTRSGSTSSRTIRSAPGSSSSRSRRFPRSLVIAAVFWFLGRERRTPVRPGVRAGAADRHGARARPHAPAAGRRGGVVRVHGDALRPDPARRLHGDADDDRAEDLGRAPHADGVRSRALAGQDARS